MKEKKVLKLGKYITTTFVSFAIVILLQSLLGDMYLLTYINSNIIYATFIICLLVSLLMFITDHIMLGCSCKSIILVRLLDMYVVVFFMQWLIFDEFSFTFINVMINAGLLLIVYIGVYVVLFIQNQVDAKNINKKIKERKQKDE